MQQAGLKIFLRNVECLLKDYTALYPYLFSQYLLKSSIYEGPNYVPFSYLTSILNANAQGLLLFLLFLQIRSHCSYPCECSSLQPACPAGVSVVRDGCGCCAICARQQGEQCDGTTLCDEKRGLVCQYPHRATVKGVCQGIVILSNTRRVRGSCQVTRA
jgi:hypothetical protein